MCTDQWRGTFDVMVDREMTNAVLNVRFYDGETICGHGSTGFDILPADTRVSFTVQKIVFSDEFGTFKQPCQLPATTNRIEAVLWSDHGNWTNVLIQVFEAGYTFSESPRSPAVDLTGSYALTFEVGSGCEQVPKELRTRSYEASIEYWKSVESRDLFFAELSGSTFHHYHRG